MVIDDESPARYGICYIQLDFVLRVFLGGSRATKEFPITGKHIPTYASNGVSNFEVI